MLTGCLGGGSAETTEEEQNESDGSVPKPYEYADLELLNEDRTRILAFTMGDWEECCKEVPYHWHFEPLRVRLGGSRTVRARIKDRVIEDATSESHELRAKVLKEGADVDKPDVTQEELKDIESMPAGFSRNKEIPEEKRGEVRAEARGSRVEIHGIEKGEVEVVFEIVHIGPEGKDEQTAYKAPPFTVRVIEI